MPAIIAALWRVALFLTGSFVGRVLMALGLGFVEYQGLSLLWGAIRNQSTGIFAALGGSLLGEWLGFFRVDVLVSIIVSAIGVKMALSALNGASVKRLVRK